jgi:hypothetical protein
MSLVREIRRALEGALRLFLFDAGGLRYFNMSIAGFWRSFLATLIAAPLIMVVVVLQDALVRATAEPDMAVAPLATKLGVEIFTYPVGVVLFPIAMIGLSRLLKVTDRYVPYIIAYNWSSVVTALIGLFPLLLFATGFADARSSVAALLGINLVIVVYLWFIARASLAVSGLTAAGLVAIDVLLSFLLEGIADQLSG